jgi:hypothetical protein
MMIKLRILVDNQKEDQWLVKKHNVIYLLMYRRKNIIIES